ncbi:hypothetical protein D6D28_01258 [Aureobasidium pullulans]|uniref:Uncharacterized protein n=1 Tax=Aureobasidium pullulans TaxID=5580 RepID=A0A4S8SY81_AURPU|nr:hypothetical protein D6D28_01258 [Aureobasidium pullulans]
MSKTGVAKAERQSPQGERPTAPRSESAHAVSESLSTSQADEAGGDLENEWNLDDAQDQIAEGQTRTAVDAEPKLTFFEKYCQKTDRLSTGQLALPVVLPQRRPRDRSRGFIRAYAPMLQDVSIDQTTWLDFLDTLQKSSAADPWLNAINMASIGTMFMPHVIGIAVSYAILVVNMPSEEEMATARAATHS